MNKPSVTTSVIDRDQQDPYVHQDYPRVMYRGDEEQRRVGNAEIEAEAIAEGYSRTPPPTDAEKDRAKAAKRNAAKPAVAAPKP